MDKAERKIEQIYEFLNQYIENNGFPPSYREISAGVGLKSINSVKEYLDILEQRGKIRKQSAKNRCIELIGKEKSDVIDLPIVGRVAAGEPILAEQNIEDFLSISSSFFRASEKDLFMLKVYGESMIEIGINDGDFVVARRQQTAENGDVVVAMIDGSATVKTYYREKTQIRLQPENSTYSPIYSDCVEILGKVVGCIRRM